jgi:VanZ family protein
MMLKNYWPVFVWSILILILSGIPGNQLPRVGKFWEQFSPDKIVHLFLYAIFFYLLIKSTVKHKGDKGLAQRTIFYLLLIGIIFASFTEILQASIFINRTGSIYDFIANTIGCLIGLTIYLVLTKKKQIKL